MAATRITFNTEAHHRLLADGHDIWGGEDADIDPDVAAYATAFPAVNAAPGGSWFKLGTSGTKNYDEGKGVSVSHDQTLNPWTPAGGTGARKVFRSAESLLIDFELIDLTPEQYAKIL